MGESLDVLQAFGVLREYFHCAVSVTEGTLYGRLILFGVRRVDSADGLETNIHKYHV